MQTPDVLMTGIVFGDAPMRFGRRAHLWRVAEVGVTPAADFSRDDESLPWHELARRARTNGSPEGGEPAWIVERLRERPDDPLTEDEFVRLVEEVF